MSYDFRIDSISFTNIKGFKKYDKLYLNESTPTVILGANGAGKSTILEMLFQNIPNALSAIRMNQKSSTLNVSHISKSANSGNIDTYFKVTKTFFNVNPYIDEFYQIKFNFQAGIDTKKLDQSDIWGYQEEIRSFSNKLQAQFADESEFIPLIRFFRTLKIASYDKNKSISRLEIEHRWEGYKNYDNKNIDLGEVYNFFIDQTNINNQEKFKNNDFEYNTKIYNYLFSTLHQFVNDINSNIYLKVDVGDSSRKQNIIFVKDNVNFEFLELSSGERYVMSLILELLHRNCVLNYDVENLKNVPGIVLIDEIENHLHPRWQAKFLNALQKAFPNVQFIVSTHSPLVASSVHSDQLIVLNNFEVIDKNTFVNLHGATSDQILTDYMGAPSLPDEYLMIQRELRQLISDRELDKASIVMEELKKSLKSTPAWLENLDTRLKTFLNAANREK